MILHCSYEELEALRQGARVLLGVTEHAGVCAASARPEQLEGVEALMPRLDGHVYVSTLDDQRRLEETVGAIVACLRLEMEASVLATHPAEETAVASYFDFAHALSVLDRVWEMGEEMEALIELVTGEPPTPEVARTFVCPD